MKTIEFYQHKLASQELDLQKLVGINRNINHKQINIMKANDVVTLRVLSGKSKLGFGKYHDVTIGDILKVDPTYVAWMYCNNPSISFHKDILNSLQLKDIQKPGIDKEYFYNWRNAYVIRTYSKEERMHFVVKKRAMEKRKAHASLSKAIRDEYKTKGQLQAMNLGRM